MAQLACQNLCLGYDGKEIVHNLNFEINKGDYFCIVGENGSGKSTLIKTILGLQSAMSGKISYSDGLTKNEIGYLPQQTVIQKDFPASVWEIVISGCQSRCGLRPFYSKKDKQNASEILEKLNISDLKNKCYRELSGGQQQRVLLARALCATQKMLLLDEPVSGLDPVVTEDLYKIICDLNSAGITIIMISHDIQAAVRYADKILHIGDEVFFGSKQEYVESKTGRAFTSKGDSENGNN